MNQVKLEIIQFKFKYFTDFSRIVNLLEFSTTEPASVEKSNQHENNGNITKNLESNAPNESIENEKKCNGTYEVIPYFYSKLPKSHDLLAQKLREEARTLFLQKRSKELLDNNELRTLWSLLQKNFTPPSINNEQFINYDDYMRVVKIAGEKFKYVQIEIPLNILNFPFHFHFGFVIRIYLTSSIFLRLQTISGYPGHVNIMSLFNYTMRKVWLQQTRIGLSLYDYTGQGFLR